MSRRERWVLVIVYLLICLVSATRPLVAQEAFSTVPPPVRLRVLTLPFLSFAPYFIAYDEGYFVEQGLDVEFIQMQQGTEAIPALVQGQLDVYGGFINAGLINVIEEQSAVRIVADKGYLATEGCAADVLMVASGKQIERALADPKTRSALRFSANIASVEGYFLSKTLSPYGLGLRDIHIEYIANAAVEMEALRNGRIDVAVVSEPWVTRIEQTGAGRTWQRISARIPGFQSGVIAFGSTLLVKNRDAGRRFIAAYLKGVRQFSLGKTERNLTAIARHTGMDSAILKTLCWPTFKQDGRINSESLVDFLRWSKDQGLIDSIPKVTDYWDGSFVESATTTTNLPRK